MIVNLDEIKDTYINPSFKKIQSKTVGKKEANKKANLFLEKTSSALVTNLTSVFAFTGNQFKLIMNQNGVKH